MYLFYIALPILHICPPFFSYFTLLWRNMLCCCVNKKLCFELTSPYCTFIRIYIRQTWKYFTLHLFLHVSLCVSLAVVYVRISPPPCLSLCRDCLPVGQMGPDMPKWNPDYDSGSAQAVLRPYSSRDAKYPGQWSEPGVNRHRYGSHSMRVKTRKKSKKQKSTSSHNIFVWLTLQLYRK